MTELNTFEGLNPKSLPMKNSFPSILFRNNINDTTKAGESDAKYRSFFENSMDGLLITVTDGDVLTANPAACELFRMTEEEICKAGRFGLADLTDPRLMLLIEERRRNGKAKGVLTLIRKDGSRFEGELTSAVYNDEDGNQRTTMIIRDVTKAKSDSQKLIAATNASERALHDLKKIMNSSLDIICSIDEEGSFVNINAVSANIWGYIPPEMVGRLLIDYVSEGDRQLTLNMIHNVMNGRAVTMFENNFVHKDGSIVPMLWSARWDSNDKLMFCIGRDASEKKKLERAFEIERQRFYDLYFQAPVAMGIFKGPDHVFELANPVYLHFIGKKNIIGKPLAEVLPEVVEQGVIEVLDNVYKTGQTFLSNETLIKVNKDGSGNLAETYSNFMCQPYRNSEGIIEGIFFFVADVTEQVLSRKKIEETEKQYIDLIQNLPIAVYTCNTKGNIIIYNKAAINLWGKEPDMEKDLWTGAIQINRVDGTLLSQNDTAMAVTVREGKPASIEEIIIKRPDGSHRHVMPHPSPIVDSSGRLLGAVNMLLDITDIRNYQDALHNSEKKYRQIVEAAIEGIWMIDENIKISFVNKKMCEMLEYTAQDMIGKHFLNFIEEPDRDRASTAMQRREGHTGQAQFLLTTATGKKIWTNISINPLFNEDGSYRGALAMVSDITETIKMQEKLLAEKINKQRDITKASINAQERERKNIGAELHDNVNQLLAASNLYLNHALANEDDYKTSVIKSLEYISNAMEDIRKLTKALAAPANDNTMGFIASVNELVNDITILKDINISFENNQFDENQADAPLKLVLYRIIQEQLSNIIKHAHAAQVGIKLSQDERSIHLTISDDGIGFDTSKPRNGIGITNIKNRVAAYDGTVYFKTQPGEGCVLSAIFPVEQ